MDKYVTVAIRTVLLMLRGLHDKPHNQHSSTADTLAWFLNINQIIFCLEHTTKQCSSREINSIPCSEHVEGNVWVWFLKQKSLFPKGRWEQSKGRSCENISSVRHLLDLWQFEYKSLSNMKVQQDSDKSNCTMSYIPNKSNPDNLTESNTGEKAKRKQPTKPNQTKPSLMISAALGHSGFLSHEHLSGAFQMFTITNYCHFAHLS